jgi:hypothetical protein
MGTKADERRRSRIRNDDNQLQSAIAKAREYIFVQGMGVTGTWVRQITGEKSLMPIQVYFSPHNKDFHNLTYIENLECIFNTALQAWIQLLFNVCGRPFT